MIRVPEAFVRYDVDAELWSWVCLGCERVETYRRLYPSYTCNWLGWSGRAADAADAARAHLVAPVGNSVSRQTRAAVMAAYDNTCAACGEQPVQQEAVDVVTGVCPEPGNCWRADDTHRHDQAPTGISYVALELDHIVPKRFSGTNAPHNLQPLCGRCHRIKTAREAVEAARRRRSDIYLVRGGR